MCQVEARVRLAFSDPTPLVSRTVEVCRGPRDVRYGRIERAGADAELEPEALPGMKPRVANALR